MKAREQLLKRKLARMREGQEAFEIVNLVSDPEIRVAIVPLKEKEHEMGYSYAASIMVDENSAGMVLRNRAKNLSDLWNACREVDDRETKVWDDIEQMAEDLDATDIDHLLEAYFRYSQEFSPDIDNMTEEEMEELKKVFGSLRLSELSGQQRAAVSISRSLLLPTLPTDKSPGSSSTRSSTPTKNGNEHISTAEASLI